MKKKGKVVFKRYEQNQPMLLPPSYEDMVPLNHPVRAVNEVVECQQAFIIDPFTGVYF